MKKILVAAAVVMVACITGNANAQCIGCQQNAQPVFSSAPVQSFAPVQSYGVPVQNYAPIQSYSAPIQSYSAPIQSYSAPVQSFAPVQSYDVPVQSFSPVESYGIPVQSYSAPIQSFPVHDCGCGGNTIGQPIYGGTITSGAIMDHGVVEGSVIASEPMVDTPVETVVEPAAPAKADTMEPPVPPVSTPGPEADGT